MDGPGYYLVTPNNNTKTRKKDENRTTVQSIYFQIFMNMFDYFIALLPKFKKYY